MNIFKKLIDKEEAEKPINEVSTPTPEPEPEEEWVWVEGYKGTDKDMKCRDFQYELGTQYDIPDGQVIEECKSGFHLCLELADVFCYYGVGDGNRYFKVKALVRKSDKDNYSSTFVYNGYYIRPGSNKLAAKSIVFISELKYDEILKDSDAQNLPEGYKKMAIDTSIKKAVDEYCMNTLLEDGYSKPFAAHIVKINKFEAAHAFGSQKDLSMDMKVFGILYNT